MEQRINGKQNIKTMDKIPSILVLKGIKMGIYLLRDRDYYLVTRKKFLEAPYRMHTWEKIPITKND